MPHCKHFSGTQSLSFIDFEVPLGNLAGCGSLMEYILRDLINFITISYAVEEC
ncbi:protein of unknown function [Legionella fallonii LLAP-10]|uniref:Uncharacterized protein n=1 Tax=Legionella fallonii LLAP-10 TaxID=1212491 RepID=A0A098GB27_9GAMM|nr:protein of unknown function [Legionella fallonii LLAP-10]